MLEAGAEGAAADTLCQNLVPDLLVYPVSSYRKYIVTGSVSGGACGGSRAPTGISLGRTQRYAGDPIELFLKIRGSLVLLYDTPPLQAMRPRIVIPDSKPMILIGYDSFGFNLRDERSRCGVMNDCQGKTRCGD